MLKVKYVRLFYYNNHFILLFFTFKHNLTFYWEASWEARMHLGSLKTEVKHRYILLKLALRSAHQ